METVTKRIYEGMFLVDSGEAAADWQAVIGVIEKVLARSEAEVVSLKKWDERRLAYDINKKGRGTYILVYFKCDPVKIGAIERDVQLSERIMRVLILRTDKMSAEDMERATPVMRVEAEAAAAAESADSAARRKAADAEAAAEAEDDSDVDVDDDDDIDLDIDLDIEAEDENA